MSKSSHAAVRSSEHPTPAQLKELFIQIQHGIVTKETLQSFLRGQKKPTRNAPFVIPGVPTSEVDSLVAYWDKWFPKKGKSISRLLGSFVAKSYEFGVHERWADEAFCKDAIFWRKINGVVAAPQDMVELTSPAEMIEWQFPADGFSEELLNFLSEKCDKDVWKLVPQAIEDTDSGDSINYLSDIIEESEWDWSIGHSLQLGIKSRAYRNTNDNWLATCYAVIACQYLGEEFRQRIKSLVSLWQFGNIPLGFRENTLVLLCKP